MTPRALSIKNYKRRIITLILLLSCVITAACAAMLYAAGSSLSNPVRADVGRLPDDLRGEDVEFESASGARLRGWFIEGREGEGAVVLMHGVRASRRAMTGRARFLNRQGYSVLLFDFQAHGASTGERITFGYLESRDARAAVGYIKQRVPNERVGVIGVSMGGAAALLAEPPLEIDALVLEMVYPTIDDAVANRLAMMAGEWGRIMTPALTWQLKPRLGIAASELRPGLRAASLSTPKFFIVGAADGHTTLRESEMMFQAAREPKSFWAIDGAAHTDLHAYAPDEYERRVSKFFKRYLNEAFAH